MINAFIIGRLGADAEVKTSKAGTQFVSMRVASNEYVSGDNVTTWVNVTWMGDRALKMAQHMKKGSHVSMNGPIRMESYTNKNNETAYGLTIFPDRVDFVSSGNSGSTANNSSVVDTGTFKKQEEVVAAAAAPSTTAAASIDDLPF